MATPCPGAAGVMATGAMATPCLGAGDRNSGISWVWRSRGPTATTCRGVRASRSEGKRRLIRVILEL